MVKAEKKEVPAKQAVMLLLHKNGNFLVEKRVKKGKSYYYGEVIISGRKIGVDSGELPELALFREVEEESGAGVKYSVWLDTIEYVLRFANSRRVLSLAKSYLNEEGQNTD